MIGSNVRAGIVLDASDNTGAAFTSLQQRLATAKVKLGEVGETAAALPARFGTVGAALAAAFTGVSLKGAIDAADRLDDLSEKTGIAARELSELRYAGEVTGTPLESLAGGMKKLAVNMLEAANGGKEQAATFKALQVEYRNADGSLRATDKVIEDLADRFASMPDGPEKAALAIKTFGKAGEELIPLLNQGSTGIRNLRVEAQLLGATIGNDFAKQSAAFNDNIRKIELASEGAKSAIAAQLIRPLNDLATAFLESRIAGESWVDTIGSVLTEASKWGAMGPVNALSAWAGSLFNGGERETPFAKIGRELRELQAQRDALLAEGGFDDPRRPGRPVRLKTINDRIAALSERQANLAIYNLGDTSDAQSRRTKEYFKPVRDSADKPAKDTTYARLSDSIQQRIELSQQELRLGRELTEMERFEVKVLEDLRVAGDKVTAGQRLGIAAQLDFAKASQLSLEIQRSELAQAKELATQRQKIRNADTDSVSAWLREQEQAAQARVAAIRERTQSIQDELQAMQLATEQNISLAEAVELVAIARARERLERLNDDGDEAARVRAEIEEREKLLQMLGKQRITQEFQQNWQRLVDDVYQGLTDSLFRAFESGNGFFRTFWAGIKNTFKTTVLRLAIQAVLGTSGSSGLIGQLLQVGSGVANVGSGIGNLGNLGNLASLGSNIGNLLGFGSGSSVFTQFATSSIGQSLGLAMPIDAIGGIGTASSALTSAGSMFAAAGPWVAAAAALYALSKSFKGETRGGGQYNFGNLIAGPSGGELAAGGAAAGATADAINALLASVGSSSRLSNFMTGLETSSKGKGFAYAGGTLTTGQAFGQGWGAAFAQDGWMNRAGNFTAEEAVAAFQEELLQATLQALQAATDVPEAIASLLRGKNLDTLAKTELEGLLTQVNTIVADFGRFTAVAQALPFERLTGLSLDMATALAKAAGGMDSLLAGLQGFYSADFFTGDELRRNTARNIQRTLAEAGADFSVDDILRAADLGEVGRQMWRQTVEAFEQRVAQGDQAAAPMLAALYSMSQAFASITPLAEELGDTIADAFDEAAQARADYLRDLGGAGGTIADLVRKLSTTRGGLATPLELLSNTRGNYLSDLGAARSGDVGASLRIADSAQAYIDAQLAYGASGAQSQATISQVLAELQALPAFVTYEQQMIEQGRQQAALLADIKVNTSATVSAVASGFQGIAGWVPNTPAAAPTTPSGGASWGGSTVSQGMPPPATVASAAPAGGAAWGGSATATQTFAQALQSIDWADGAAGRAAMVGAMQRFGATIADAAEVYNWFTPQQLADDLKANGYGWAVPGYAQGANVIPSTQLAVLHPNEAVLPAPFNPWAGGVLPLDDGGTREAVEALAARVDQVVERVDRLTAVVAAFARENVSQGAQLVDNTAASRTAALIEANRPTPVQHRGGRA